MRLYLILFLWVLGSAPALVAAEEKCAGVQFVETAKGRIAVPYDNCNESVALENSVQKLRDQMVGQDINGIISFLGKPESIYKMPNGNLLYAFRVNDTCSLNLTTKKNRVKYLNTNPGCH